MAKGITCEKSWENTQSTKEKLRTRTSQDKGSGERAWLMGSNGCELNKRSKLSVVFLWVEISVDFVQKNCFLRI